MAARSARPATGARIRAAGDRAGHAGAAAEKPRAARATGGGRASADGAAPAVPERKGRSIQKSVGWALTVLARLHRAELGARLAGLGLFPGQEQVLQALDDNESMTMSALAELMQVRPPTASKAVARLSAQGLVARVGGATGDGRLVRVALTEEGRVRAAEIAGIWRKAEQQLLTGFDNRDRKRLRKLLRRAAGNVRQEDARGQERWKQEGSADDAGRDGAGLQGHGPEEEGRVPEA